MTPLKALLLAAVQGATEFLPVSSFGHLVLIRQVLGWSDDGGLLFDIVLHAGSLAAILVYFWRDWLAIINSFKRSAFPAQQDNAAMSGAMAEAAAWRRLPFLVVLATLPTVVAAPLLKDVLELGARTATSVAASMLVTALWFFLAERKTTNQPQIKLTWRRALAVGCSQVIALLPGASRSGWTAGAGLLAGLPRVEAVRFAFYMAVPAIAGAIVFELPLLFREMTASAGWRLIAVALGMSFVFSLVAIHFCLRFFKTRSLRPFAFYLLAVGTLIIVLDAFL